MKTIASAPGKVVLSGEYAVLDGAPAICMAVDRRAVAVVSPAANSTALTRAPAYTETIGEYRTGAAGIDWLHGGDEFELIDAVLTSAGSQLLLDMNVDTSAFYEAGSGLKLGLGSSAALTVALLTAVKDSADVLSEALHAHSVFQKGSGSGVDIAVSALGGLIEYRMDDARPVRLGWPPGLHYRLLWMGQSACTTARLSRLQAAGDHSSRRALAVESGRVADCWRLGNAATLLESYADYIDVLHRFSVDHDLGIFDAGHAELSDAAEVVGIVYKPCGAGGGDIGIALSTNEQLLNEFLQRRTITVIDCALDPGGARIVSE